MKVTFSLLTIIAAGAAVAQMPVQKPIEVTVGAAYFTGDRSDADLGILLGLDYYMNKAYGSQTMPFVGIRYHRSKDGGLDLDTYGVHIGARYGLPANPGSTGNFYVKGALGYYNSDVEIADDWGLGGFVAAGYEMRSNMSVELGYQIAPKVGGYDNKSFYGAFTFRL